MLLRIRYLVYLFIFLLVMSACSGDNRLIDEKIDPFSFIDQNNETFGTDDLLGTVWIASFVFTNCETVCPPMMYETASLQKKFAKEKIDVEFVSFTVDPTIDTPEVLKDYVQQFTEYENNWHMLTGYSQGEIEDFGRNQFKTIIQKPDSSNQVIHGTNFYLVDETGYVMNEYNYIDDSYMEEIIKDVENMRE